MKIASWNVNSLRVRLPHVLDWLEREQPDVLALQETKLADPDFPDVQIQAAGYHAVYAGQKTYNGVALLSRTRPEEVIADIAGLDDPQRRILAATVGDVRVLDLYVPNGQSVGSEKYAYKLDWLAKVTLHIEQCLHEHSQLVVLGDFNIAPQDRDVHDPQAWAGQVLCSDAEREAFGLLLGKGLKDSFRLFDQPDESFSWWDYRAAAFRRNRGLRIDHILLSSALQAHCARSWIDVAPRRLERPSDHAPVVVELEAGCT